MLERIFFGIFFIGLGASLIYFSAQLYKLFGRWNWAETYIGGTRQGYALIGFGLMIFGFLVLFGVVDLSAKEGIAKI